MIISFSNHAYYYFLIYHWSNELDYSTLDIMDQNLAFLLSKISTFWGIIPSILAIFVWKRKASKNKLLPILVWGGTAISLTAYIVGYLLKTPNLFLLHIYTIFEFILLLFIFKSVLNQGFRKILLFAFPLFAATNSIFFEQLSTMNILNRSISALFIMFFALSFFLVSLRRMEIEKIEREPLFWVSIGVLFYNAASFFIFLFSKNLEPHEELWFTYFGIHAFFTILLYTFYSIALWTQLKAPQIYPSN